MASLIQQRLDRIRREAKEKSQQLSKSHNSSGLSSLTTGQHSVLQQSSLSTHEADLSNIEANSRNGDAERGGFRRRPRLPSPTEINEEDESPQNITEPLKGHESPSSHIERSKSNSQLPPLQRRRILIKGHCYSLMNSIGRGGSSVVYQAFDEADFSNVAIKCVDLSKAEQQLREAYENEIELLRSLQPSPHVIRLLAYEKLNSKLLVVMEKGDIDLASFMHKRSDRIDDKFIKYHWNEMLKCVKVIHDRNIVHSDLKPSNFLFVNASLKLIDFGIASSIPSNTTSVVKEMQIGTLNYMSPEAITSSYVGEGGTSFYKIPLKSDCWSLGCILYQLVYGRTPFGHINNQIARVNAIISQAIEFPPVRDPLLLDVMQKRCLVRAVEKRAGIDELLAHPYLA